MVRSERIRVLVAGVPRAGTTWVAQTLAHTPGAVYVHEPDNHRHTPYALRAKRTLGAFPWLEEGDDGGDYGTLWDRAFEGGFPHRRTDAVLQRLQSHADEAELDAAVTPDAHAPFLLRSVAAVTREPKRHPSSSPSVIVKTVQCSLALAWVAAREKARVVVVQRHPLNVISSWVEMEFRALAAVPGDVAAHYCARWGIGPIEPDDSDLARTTWRVAFHMSVLEEAVQANPDFIRVSHDGLCRDPLNGFRDLAQRCGLTWSDAAQSFLALSNRPGYRYDVHRITADQPDRWRERLTHAQADEAMAVLAGFPIGAWAAEAIA
jgi:Sulfotransferase family